MCGPIAEVSGAVFATLIGERPVPLGVTYGHTKGAVSNELAPVENEDVVTFTARFENGAIGTYSASRVAQSLPDGLAFELFGAKGSAAHSICTAQVNSRSRPTTSAATSVVRGEC